MYESGSTTRPNRESGATARPPQLICSLLQTQNSTMRSFATVAAAAAVLSTASAFVPQAQRSPLSAAISAPATSNIVLNQAAEEDDPLDFTPEVCAYVRAMRRPCVRSYPLVRFLRLLRLFKILIFLHTSFFDDSTCRAPKSASRRWSMPILSFSS